MITPENERARFLADMKIIEDKEGWSFSQVLWDEEKQKWDNMYTNWMWWAWRQAQVPYIKSLENFCNRVEIGEIRSQKTYKEFKELLND